MNGTGAARQNGQEMTQRFFRKTQRRKDAESAETEESGFLCGLCVSASLRFHLPLFSLEKGSSGDGRWPPSHVVFERWSQDERENG